MKKEKIVYTKQQLRNYYIVGIISGTLLLMAIGISIRKVYGVDHDPGHAVGIVTEIYWRGIKSKFRYEFYISHFRYEGSSSFYSANIEPGDTVYVLYEKDYPDNNRLELKDLGRGGSGGPIYSKARPIAE